MNNPYLNSGYNYSNNSFLPQTKVPVVNGREGANTYRMAPDSQVILLDISGKLIWIVSTDSGGYKTVEGYDIQRHVEPEPPDYNLMLNKINQLEATLSGLVSAINNTGSTSTGADSVKSFTNSANTATANATTDITKQF